ncbi:MAG: hypothetical protein E7040_12175 [Lentisphaerae bacterium]|nr:hypothetical protein [Lentisphaerota bacterium]
MPQHPQKPECPSHEQLSAYFDKESSRQEEIGKHLKNCSSCRNYVDSLSKIEYSLKHTVTNKTGSDEDISKRILSRVHASVSESGKDRKHKFFLSPVQWRVVVLLLIGCAVGYLLWSDMQKDKMEKQKTKRVIQPSATVTASLTPAQNNKPAIRESENFYFSADSDQKKLPSGIKPQIIKQDVHHEWSQPAQSGIQISELLKKHNIPQDSLKKSDKGFQIQCTITKLQAAQFVKSCSDAGYKLLSQDQPQPGQKYFAGQGTDKVKYHADITLTK